MGIHTKLQNYFLHAYKNKYLWNIYLFYIYKQYIQHYKSFFKSALLGSITVFHLLRPLKTNF